jgi:hypothetical protein
VKRKGIEKEMLSALIANGGVRKARKPRKELLQAVIHDIIVIRKQ